MQNRRELLTWNDVDKLIDHLLPQFEVEFDAMVMITRGGIVPGGLLAETLGLTHILTAAVDFPAEMEREKTGLFAWPRFLQFPEDTLLRERHTLVVDDVWGSGRNITAVKTGSPPQEGCPTPACCTSTRTAACLAARVRIIMPPSQTRISFIRGKATAVRTGCCWGRFARGSSQRD
jgi:uncharacterized protein